MSGGVCEWGGGVGGMVITIGIYFLRKEQVFRSVICIVDLCQIRLLYFLGKIKV